MNLGELVSHTRSVVLRDNAEPVLWSTDELALYAVEGEKLFARKTHCLVSEDETVCSLSTEASKPTYSLSPSIIHVYEVLDDETGHPLHDRPRSRMSRGLGEGRPRAYTLGRGSKKITLSPTPDDVYGLTMLVAHTPLGKPTTKYYTFEIPEEYHLSLAYYVAYKALVNNDPEGSNTVAAGGMLTLWDQAVREAKRDVFRLRVPYGATVRNNWTAGRRR